MMPVDKLTLIRSTSSVLCTVNSYRHIKDRQTGGESGSTYIRTTLAEKFTTS